MRKTLSLSRFRNRLRSSQFFPAWLTLSIMATGIFSPVPICAMPFSASPTYIPENNLSYHPPFNLNLPLQFVRIDESYNPFDRKLPDIVFIADAHANLDAQRKIAAFLEHQLKAGAPSTILVEGAAGAVDTSLLGYFPDVSIRNSIADDLLQKLRLSGAEFFTATHPEMPVATLGIEEPGLYKRNLDAFQTILGERTDALRAVNQIDREFSELASLFYADEFQRFCDLKKRADHRVEDGWINYITFLTLQQKMVHLDAVAYPILTSLKDMHQPAEHPIDYAMLSAEIEQAEKVIARRSLESYESLMLYTLTSRLELLKHALMLTLSPEEARIVSQNAELYSFENFETFLKRVKPDTNSISGWDSALIQSVIRFYKLAHDRDKSLAANILKKRNPTRSSTIVITGGFHRRGITRRLRRVGLSYIVLTPLIHSETNHAVYQRIMNSSVPSDTLAFASTFDLEPLEGGSRAAAFQSSLVARILAIQAAEKGRDRFVLLHEFERAYFRTLHGRIMDSKARGPARVRAQNAFDRVRDFIEKGKWPGFHSHISSGFGRAPSDAQSNHFEIDRIRQVMKGGGNNIVFFGGSSNVNKAIKVPLQDFLGEYVLFGSARDKIKVPVIDAQQIKMGTEMLDALVKKPDYQVRLAGIARKFLGRDEKHVLIIKNFHLINQDENLRRLVEQFLADKSNFLVGIAPAISFQSVESAWGNTKPLNYSWRPFHGNSQKAQMHRKRKAVLFGASGFAGQPVYHFLKSARNKVVGTYRTGDQLSDDRRREMLQLDVTDKQAVQRFLDDENPDDIFYFSGDTNLDQLQNDPQKAFALHADALRNLEPFFKRKPNARLIYISTDAVFSGDVGEGDPWYLSSSPTSPPRQAEIAQTYAESKIEGERLAQLLNPDYFVIVRLSYLVGASAPDIKRKPKIAEMVIKALDARVVNGQEEIPLDNTRVRQPFLIDLIGETIERFLINDAQGVYQIAGPAALTEYDFAQAAAAKYARMFPFVGFEKSPDHLARTFRGVEIKKEAPRGRRSLMVPSDIPLPLDAILERLISEISSAGRGSGRSVVIDKEAGTVLKRSAVDERGKQKLRDEIAWIKAAREIPELKDHVPEIVHVLDTAGKVELVIKRFDAPSLIDSLIAGKYNQKTLRKILMRVYGFMADVMYKQKLGEVAPVDILEIHHLDRMLDRLEEYREKAAGTGNERSKGIVQKLTSQNGVRVNGSKDPYPNLLYQLHRLTERLSERRNSFFRKVITPPDSAVVFAHADPHLGNLLVADFGNFMLIDPKGHLATDYLYDAAKVIHDFVGKFQLFNYSRFDVNISESGAGVSVDFGFDPHDRVRQLLDRFVQSGDMSKLLLSTFIPEEIRISDPYWFIRLAFTHAVLWSSIAPFQVRGDNIDTSAAIYAYGLQLFQEFFDLYDDWESGQLKKFVTEKGGRYLGFSYQDLQQAGFPVKGLAGFGSTQTVDETVKPQIQNALAQIESMVGDELSFSSEHALKVFESDYSRLGVELQKLSTQSSLIITDEKHLPNSFSAIENQIRSGRLAFTFRGTKEEGKRFFEKKFQQLYPEGFVEVLAYQDDRLVPQIINEYVRTNSANIESTHTVSYFGQEHPKILTKLLRGTYRVYALEGGIDLLEWDVLRLLSMVGNEHPAVRPFLLPFNDRGVLKIASIEEYLYQAIQSHERIAIAA